MDPSGVFRTRAVDDKKGEHDVKKKILVVDDEAHITMLLKMRLQAEGYDVELAADGEEGSRR